MKNISVLVAKKTVKIIFCENLRSRCFGSGK